MTALAERLLPPDASSAAAHIAVNVGLLALVRNPSLGRRSARTFPGAVEREIVAVGVPHCRLVLLHVHLPVVEAGSGCVLA